MAVYYGKKAVRSWLLDKVSMNRSDYLDQRRAMVDCQVRPSDVTRFPIIEAMLECPREAFVPDNLRSVAYLGDHLPLSEDRYILDPRIFAKMLNALDIRRTEFVLDIGCGYGYSSAVISHLAEAVVALESGAMADTAAANLSAYAADNTIAKSGILRKGAPEFAPYDVMIVQGGVERLPDDIAAQLRDGGRIACIFVDRAPGECRVGIKRSGQISWHPVFDADAPLLADYKMEEMFVF